MSPLPLTLTFPNITLDKWQAIRANFAAHGVDVPDATSGTINAHGARADFSLDAETLTITVVSKPWYVSVDQISNGLRDFVNNS